MNKANACSVVNAIASTTLNTTSRGTFSGSYGDNSTVKGDYITDTFSLGPATIANQTMALVSSTGFGSNIAIMGVGLQQDEFSNDNHLSHVNDQNCQEYGDSCDPVPKTSPTFVDSLVLQNITGSRSYSLWMDDISEISTPRMVHKIATYSAPKMQPQVKCCLAATTQPSTTGTLLLFHTKISISQGIR